MKLISETPSYKVKHLVESVRTGKDYYIEGIFMQADIVNHNRRVYPKAIMDREVEKYQELIKTKRSYGELGHPENPDINLERVSHIITELKPVGSDYHGRAKIIDTPYGKIVKNLMDEGCTLGVSSRGMGSVESLQGDIETIQDDFWLSTAGDIVADPAAPKAFVRGIMEGIDWEKNIVTGNWTAKNIISRTKKIAVNRKLSPDYQKEVLGLFNQFMKAI